MDDLESYIDDRCPTIWGGPSPSYGNVLHEAKNEHRSEPRTRAAIGGDGTRTPSYTSQEAPRVKPIDGALLLKLYQATMDERRRAEAAEKLTRQHEYQRQSDEVKLANERNASHGFYVPVDGSRGEKIRCKEPLAKEKQPVETAKEKKAKQKASAVKRTAPAPDYADRPPSNASRKMRAVQDPRKSNEKGRESLPERQPKRQEKQDQGQGQPNQTNKQSKKQKKKQAQAEKDRAKAATEAAEALMSGALPDEQDQPLPVRDGGGGWIEIGNTAEVEQELAAPKADTPWSNSKSDRAKLQPTVESVASSQHSRRPKESLKTAFANADAEKTPSALTWEEIGQGMIEEDAVKVASRIATPQSRSKKSSFHGFEEVAQGWNAQDAEPIFHESHDSRARLRSNPTSSSKSRELEVEKISTPNNRSRYSEMNHRTETSAAGCGQMNDPWLQEEPALRKSSKARSSHKKAPPAEVRVIQDNTWPQDDFQEASDQHSAPGQHSKAPSQLTFEEIGEAWAQPIPAPVRAQVFTHSGQSRQPSVYEVRAVSHNWSRHASEKSAPSKVMSKADSPRSFEEVGRGWQGPDRLDFASRSLPASAAPKAVSTQAHTVSSWGKKQSHAPASRHELDNADDGWEEIGEQQYAVHSHRSPPHSARSKSASANEWNRSLQGDERWYKVQSQRTSDKSFGEWDEVDEQHSGLRSARGTHRSHDSSDSGTQLDDNRPTVFAGRGWISPHPLSRSPTEMASPPQSKIMLPSEAFPHGATMTYEQWKKVQERGMRRNFSPTESHITMGARRAESRHRFAGWGPYSSDGYRLEGVEEEASAASMSGPASYRPPTVDSELSDGGMFSDERPPSEYSYHSREHSGFRDDGPIPWGDRPATEYSERSGRHSRVQTLSAWSHDHSGSKEAHDGSQASVGRGSLQSGQVSIQQSSRRSSHRTHHRSSHRSDRHSDSTQSQRHPHSRKSSHGSRQSSHKSSRHSSRPSLFDRIKALSPSWRQPSDRSAGSSRTSHKSHGRSNRASSRHGERLSKSAQSQVPSMGWKESSHGSGGSRHTTNRSSHASSRHNDRLSLPDQIQARSASGRTHSHGFAEARRSGWDSALSHDNARSASVQSQRQSTGWQASIPGSRASLSADERDMEVMEEGRNIWSDVVQYDGTVSDRDRIQNYIDRGDASQARTSQLYFDRYRGDQASISRWE